MTEPSSTPEPPGRARLLDDVVAETSAVVRGVDLALAASRGPMQGVINAVSVFNQALTLWPVIHPRHHVEVLVEKNLLWLWNFSVDDRIDRDGSARELMDSADVLLGDKRAAQTPAGRLLREVLTRAGELRGEVTPLMVAMTEMIAAFHYTHGCREYPTLAEPDRYLHHAVTTNGMNVYLAIDLIAADGALDHAQVALAHRTFGELSTAMRYAHDASCLERERREGSLNIIDLWRLDGLAGDDEALRRRAADCAQLHVAQAREMVTMLEVPGLAAVVHSAAEYLARFSFATTLDEDGPSADGDSLAAHLSSVGLRDRR